LTFTSIDLDETLLRARRLDMNALGEIHDRFYPEVYRYVCYRLGEAQLCEDISSEVFLRLLDALHRRRGPDHNLRGWLMGTASNLVNDHLRRHYRRKEENIEDGSEDSLVDGHSPERVWEDTWQQQRVRQAIQNLTAEQQHILALRFAEEYSLEETAKIVAKTVSAVKALQFRALASLRRLLEE
jgi:RNA polymerase sigma-70 factor, ECF subfamily